MVDLATNGNACRGSMKGLGLIHSRHGGHPNDNLRPSPRGLCRRLQDGAHRFNFDPEPRHEAPKKRRCLLK